MFGPPDDFPLDAELRQPFARSWMAVLTTSSRSARVRFTFV